MIENDLQHLFITAFNHTTGCGHAEELYYIGLTTIALNNHGRFNNVTYLSGFFQNYMDDYGQFPGNETTSSVFLTNSFERSGELQGIAVYIQALGLHDWGASMSLFGLSYYWTADGFGGSISTLFGRLGYLEALANGYGDIIT